MRPIPSDIKYDELLIKELVPVKFHFHYKKWLRYYLDFCEKYQVEKANKESLTSFINKLKKKIRQMNNSNKRLVQYYCTMILNPLMLERVI
jgi:hypothetical protein